MTEPLLFLFLKFLNILWIKIFQENCAKVQKHSFNNNQLKLTDIIKSRPPIYCKYEKLQMSTL